MSELVIEKEQGVASALGDRVRAAAAKRPDRQPRAWRKGDGPAAFLFLSPTLLIFSVFVLFPVIFSFYLSFHAWNMFSADREFIGLENYSVLLSSPEFWSVLFNTFLYTVGTVPLNMALALAVAFALEKKVYGKRFLRAAFFTPVIVSWVAAAVIWKWMYDPNFGPFNHFLTLFGITPINWLSHETGAMFALILVGVWKTFGINMILFAAGLAGIPEHYYEAAEIDGAGGWSKFWNITVPLLTPTTFFILVMSIIGSFQVFDVVFVMTSGGPLGATKVLVFYLYEHAFQFFNMGYASAVAYVLFAVIFVFTLMQMRFFRDRMAY